MSKEARRAVMKYTSTKGSRRLVLLSLAHLMDEQGYTAKASQPTLQAMTGLSRSVVQYHLYALQKAQEIEIQPGAGYRQSTYKLLLPMESTSLLPSLKVEADSASKFGPSQPQSSGHYSPKGEADSASKVRPVQLGDVIGSFNLTNKATAQEARLRLIKRLEDEGIAATGSTSAKALVTHYPASVIERQLEMLPYRVGEYDPDVVTKETVLVACIKSDRRAPRAYVKAQEAQEEQARRMALREQSEQLQQQQEREQRERELRQQEENDRLDALFAALTPAQQLAVDKQVVAGLSPFERKLIEQRRLHELPPSTEASQESEADKLLHNLHLWGPELDKARRAVVRRLEQQPGGQP